MRVPRALLVGSLVLNVLLLGGAVAVLVHLPEISDYFVAQAAARRATQFAVLSPQEAGGGAAVAARSGPIVFLGDSITEGGIWSELFPGAPVRNRGIGGDTTRRLLARLDDIHRLAPRRIFLMIGVNDLNAGLPLAETEANLRSLLDDLARNLPWTEVVVQSVLPVDDRWRGRADNAGILAINQILKREAASRGLRYVDLQPLFRGPDGQLRRELSNDGIHLLGPGYEIWRQAIAPLVAAP